MKNLLPFLFNSFGKVFFSVLLVCSCVVVNAYASNNENQNQIKQDEVSQNATKSVDQQLDTASDETNNDEQLGYYDLYARSSFRSSLGALSGDIQERANILLESFQAKYTALLDNLFYNYLPVFIPQIPQKRYQIEFTEDCMIFKSTIESGDSLGSLLNGWYSLSTILNIVEESKDIYPLTSLRLGKPILFYVDKENFKLKQFEYQIDLTHKVFISFKDDAYKVEFQEIPYDYELAYVQGKVNVNFFNSVLALGEKAVFAIRLADVFTYDIDFARAIREGDTFSALVEKKYLDGQFIGYGRILGAVFVNKGKKYEAFLFHDSEDDQKISYFNRNGDALQKAFLRTPVHFTRISSRYTLARKHPILGYTRPHQGIDYAAPKGTPVMAVGDGEVTRAAYTGGYGHLIIVKHRAGLESQYAHLSGYAPSIKRGAKVTQGQIIGYVGSTGLSTGPHLDFRIKKNGNFVNPEDIIIPSKPPVCEEQLSQFKENVSIIEAYMQGNKKLDEFVAEEWLQGMQ